MTARDTQLIEDIALHLAPFHVHNVDLGILLSYSVGRILLNAGRRGENWQVLATQSEIRHISDWIAAALLRNADWLSNVDDRGRPKKLLKGGTISTLTAEADKAMLAAARAATGIRIAKDDETLYAALDDGYYIVRLLTPAALDRESAEMQHCIGDGAYDNNVADENHLYLSLRGPNGKAHATIEVENGDIVQLSGKQNRVPVKQYLDKLIPFMRNSGFRTSLSSWTLGHVVDADGYWHDIHDLPDNLTTMGDVMLGHSYDRPLPNGLRVSGALHIGPTKIAAIPSGTIVEGDMLLPHLGLAALPDSLHVGGDLHLCVVTDPKWPAGVRVDGNIYVGRGINIVFPDHFETKGGLDLNRSLVTTLPAELKVRGNLKVAYSSISVLPDGLEVGRHLDIEDSQICRLPGGLKIAGDLYAHNSCIETLPDDAVIGHSIDVRNTPLNRLPDTLHVNGDLLLSNTKITSLPANLSVEGRLDIRGLPISDLPEGLTAGSIGLFGTSVTWLPDSVPDDTVIYDEDGETNAGAFREKHKAGWVKPIFQYVR